MAVYTDTVPHKILGDISIYWDDLGKIKEVTIGPSHLDIYAIPAKADKVLPGVYSFLTNYGEAGAAPFSAEILDFTHCTPFMKKVYTTLFNTPKGSLITYSELADMSGFPRAFRAVGSAMRKNKFLLVIPCHRVVGVNSLGGFMVGMEHKIRLLELEGHKERLKKYIIDTD